MSGRWRCGVSLCVSCFCFAATSRPRIHIDGAKWLAVPEVAWVVFSDNNGIWFCMGLCFVVFRAGRRECRMCIVFHVDVPLRCPTFRHQLWLLLL